MKTIEDVVAELITVVDQNMDSVIALEKRVKYLEGIVAEIEVRT